MLKKARNRQYPAKTIIDKDDADDLVLLTNTFAYVKSQLDRLEEAAGGIGLQVNANNTK